ncbi:helix-turn-helix domain-containing protein [Streptomyces sp. NBC_01294]|uniref:helix-turn-helix domain-containing protein n=1 Tax=Streptomyces sp. NBC_01294 TaxID=2903815 RepID=UPI002DD95832|nr:helix-turn-helix transcriptional regulator [Streptomyces sp. NBC_01294]WRZ57365.1 helix-turn-helix transcriptional regulator [Streptomyces sp. NBC_01294]
MTARTSPTARQQRVGAELRRMRVAADVSAESAAGVLNVSRSQLSAIEQGLRAVSAERLRTLASHCGVVDETYIAGLTVLAQPPERGWWEAYRGTIPAGLLDVSELEWHATRLHTVQTVHLPGLLHQGAYARAVFGSVLPALPASEVELRVAHRMRRQQVLEGDGARPYTGYVHEAALRMQFGGRRATREQLEYLCAVSERDIITLRVLSVEAGAFPGAGHAMLYAEGAVRLLDTVQLDSAHGPDFTHDEPQLTKYRSHLQWMDQHALSEDASRDFIHAIARDL